MDCKHSFAPQSSRRALYAYWSYTAGHRHVAAHSVAQRIEGAAQGLRLPFSSDFNT